MKRPCHLHDQANLFLLPILGSLAILGLLGFVDPVKVTLAFTWYIVADFVWVVVQPEAVPSLPSIILVHHATTFVLLLFPLRHPQLGTFTCWDGLVEINTFFLIARRQLRTGRQLFRCLYWATFLPLRLALYPYLLVQFYRVMQPFPLWELVVVCGCQTILIAFNLMFLALSIMSELKRKQESKLARSRASGRPPAGSATVSIKPIRRDMNSHLSVQAKIL